MRTILAVVRESIGQVFADIGQYPDDLPRWSTSITSAAYRWDPFTQICRKLADDRVGRSDHRGARYPQWFAGQGLDGIALLSGRSMHGPS